MKIFVKKILTISILTLLMWVVFFIDAYFFDRQQLILYCGIQPREKGGLLGIALSPFGHANLNHLISNTIPFLIFGHLIIFGGTRRFIYVSMMSLLVGGLGVWVTGQVGSNHVGASGLIFGYFGFLLTYGWYTGRFMPLIVSLVIGFLFGGLIWGVLPGQPGISWQGHLFGFLGGVMSAKKVAVDNQEFKRKKR